MSQAIKITIGGEEIKDLGANVQAFFDWFANVAMLQIHKPAVFLVLETMVAWSRIRTGEMRAGWASYMQAYGHPYFRVMKAVTDKQDKTSDGLSMGNYSEGFGQGVVNLQIMNNVPYVGFVDDKEGIFDTSGEESYLQALYPTMTASWGRLSELYSYGWQMNMNLLPGIFTAGLADGNFDASVFLQDLGIPTNSESAS